MSVTIVGLDTSLILFCDWRALRTNLKSSAEKTVERARVVPPVLAREFNRLSAFDEPEESELVVPLELAVPAAVASVELFVSAPLLPVDEVDVTVPPVDVTFPDVVDPPV